MIHKFSVQTMHRWGQGKFKVQVVVAGSDRPVAFCDGSDADVEELKSIAQNEGTELATIHKRVLKTGREIWTIGEPPARRAATDDD